MAANRAGFRATRGPSSLLLVGRGQERALLREHLTAAIAGQGSLVLIGGEAGIGKTALASAVCREAIEQGALVLIGRCYDLTETPPYGPWIELFSRYQPTEGIPHLPDAFSQRGTVGTVTSQAELFRQVQDFFTALATARPVVILLDDAHWMDTASLDLLRFLGRSISPLPLLLLATYRVDELTRRHPLYQLLPILVREASATRIALQPLESADTDALVRCRFTLPDADVTRLVAYLDGRGEGNPFFVGELLQTLTEERMLRQGEEGWTLGELASAQVPPLLRQVIDGRLARLEQENQRLLAVASVIGQRVTFELWQAVAAVDDGGLIDCVEQATAAHLVVGTSDGAGIRFAHALIREALYEGIVPLRRRVLHRQVAQALAAQPHPNPDAVAYHFQQAGDRRAFEWLIAAGDRAERAYAWTTAIARFEAALTFMNPETDDPVTLGWLVLRLAALHRFADPHKGVALLDAMPPRAKAASNPLLSAFTLLCGLIRCYAGSIGRGLAEMEAGVLQLERLASEDRLRLHTVPFGLRQMAGENGEGPLVIWLAISGRYSAARALGERVLAKTPGRKVGDSDNPVLGDIYFGLASACTVLGEPEEARGLLRHAASEHRAVGHHVMSVIVTGFEITWLHLPYHADDLGERQRLVATLTEAVTRAQGASALDVQDNMPLLLLLEGELGALASHG